MTKGWSFTRRGEGRWSLSRRKSEIGGFAEGTVEIRTANCRQSGWLGSWIVISEISMPGLSIPSYSTAFAVVPTEERSTKTNCRGGARGDRGEESDVRYIRIARAGRLGFCRGNPVELRKGGDFFSCARSTIRVLVHYSPYRRRILSVSSSPRPSRPVLSLVLFLVSMSLW